MPEGADPGVWVVSNGKSERKAAPEKMEEKPMLWEPGVLSMAWGSVVRQIAAGLDITLDEPLTENVDRRPAERDVETASVDIRSGTMGAVRFEVVGTVDGVPRVVLEHVTRTAEDQVPEWPTPKDGGGCYRVDSASRRGRTQPGRT